MPDSFPYPHRPRALSPHEATSASDARLVAECQAGSEVAWDALLDRYEGFICAVALRLGAAAADVDDIYQEVCLKLFRHLGDLRQSDRLTAWLGAIVRQEVWRRHRQARSRPVQVSLEEKVARSEDSQTVADDLPATAQTPEETLLASEREFFVRRGLESLSPECRLLLELLYGDEGVSYGEAARSLNVPLGSIGPRRARCLERLRRSLQDWGF
jgi:RNA polymerase sigma factor (sigma-70 family)